MGIKVDGADAFFKLAKDIVVSQIMTTLGEAYCTEEDKRTDKVRWKLRKENYTMAPVMVDGVVKKFVRASDLRSDGHVSDYSIDIGIDRLLSYDTGVLDLIDYFGSRQDKDRFCFILKGNEIVGFVLPADLTKHPVCVLFYIIFSKLEIELKRLVQKHFSDDSWLDILSKREKDRVISLYERLRSQDVEISKLECLQLKHLLTIVQEDKQLLSVVGFSSKREFHAAAKRLVGFRNPTMHPVRKLINSPQEVQDLIQIKGLVLSLLERVRIRKIRNDAFEMWNQEEIEGVKTDVFFDKLFNTESPFARLFLSK